VRPHRLSNTKAATTCHDELTVTAAAPFPAPKYLSAHAVPCLRHSVSPHPTLRQRRDNNASTARLSQTPRSLRATSPPITVPTVFQKSPVSPDIPSHGPKPPSPKPVRSTQVPSLPPVAIPDSNSSGSQRSNRQPLQGVPFRFLFGNRDCRPESEELSRQALFNMYTVSPLSKR
jgi:hypothetical protein